MKVFHRLRDRLLLLLVMAVVSSAPTTPPDPDFTPCFKNVDHYKCVVHDSCYLSTSTGVGKYTSFRESDNVAQCKRYLIVRSTGSDSLEFEFRDDTLPKAPGATVKTRNGENIFNCHEENGRMKIVAPPVLKASPTAMQSYTKTYCKFTLTSAEAKSGEDLVQFLGKYVPGKINNMQITEGMQIDYLHFECNWQTLYTGKVEQEEASQSEESTATERTCKKPWFNRFKGQGEREFKDIQPTFKCIKGEIKYQIKDGGEFLYAKEGSRKCTRPKCALCECPFCGGEGRPQFIDSDGKKCTEIKCAKYMLLTTELDDSFLHPNASLHCFHEPGDHGEAKWGKSGREKEEGYSKVINATCIDEISCAVLSPITSDCTEAATEHKGMNCTLASLNGTEAAVCDAGHEIWYRAGPSGKPSKVDEFKCNALTGNWNLKPASEHYQKGSNVYCLKEFVEKGTDARSRPSGASAGTIIGIIVGVCVALFIIVIVVVLCWRRNLLKKGNRDEMPSVSITGKKSKKKKGKKGSLSSTGSKTSEQISAPPPPPCPDSLNFAVEPEPSRPHSSAQPSSGGPASAPAVGPDTGKPDKPAELIDIKLESQKKDSTESRRVKPKDSDTTVANTVTGTSIASKAEPSKGADATDKNASARSDTGTGTGASGRKKKNKMELDKHGRGLTDDDDYNIDEGAKPINHEDKNKKPYKPAVDPNKQMINVTVTEDEDGKMKAKLKPSLF